jgi:hypothetical protein
MINRIKNFILDTKFEMITDEQALAIYNNDLEKFNEIYEKYWEREAKMEKEKEEN